MYVWLRFARMAATTKKRGPYRPGGESVLSFRCLPTDIDFNLHLNNARYLMLADLGRVDIFFRSGLFALMRRRNWAPMLGGVQTAFVREIRLWQRFDVVSSIETWEGTQVVGKHRFIHENGEVAALVLTTAGVYDRTARRFVDMDEVIRALGMDTAPRPSSEVEKRFMASHNGLRALAKAGVDVDLKEVIREDRRHHDGTDL
jgi:acyl-CoA thioesterase FadM